MPSLFSSVAIYSSLFPPRPSHRGGKRVAAVEPGSFTASAGCLHKKILL
jgi:hypothetical protein